MMHLRNRMVLTGVVLVVLLLVASCVPLEQGPSEAGAGQDAPPTPQWDTTPMPSSELAPGQLDKEGRPVECPKLDSVLYQLAQAPDPIDVAQKLGLAVSERAVQVQIVMTGPDTGFLQSFGVRLASQSGTTAQAFVPVDQLCDLANRAEVSAIRVPAQAVAQ